MHKKYIFCFDGTENDPSDSGNFYRDGSISNILKLYLLLGGNFQKNIPFKNQYPFYYKGIGTYSRSYFGRTFNTLFAPKQGDLKKILENARIDLQKCDVNDGIYIFGFSRGAAIARIFASRIKEYNPKVETVNFLGVFDTVAALKGQVDFKKDTIPKTRVLFEDGNIKGHIRNVLHLVSLDEKRLIMQPTLFNKNSRVKEVWFSGAHSDVGGGFWFDGLSDITLSYMIQLAKNYGLEFLNTGEISYKKINNTYQVNCKKEIDVCKDDLDINPIHTGYSHASRFVNKRIIKTAGTRVLRVNMNDCPSTEDIPVIHHSVKNRFDKLASYRPFSLRNTKYRILLENGHLESFVRHGIADLRLPIDHKSSEVIKSQDSRLPDLDLQL